MDDTPTAAHDAPELEETRSTLLASARRRFGSIPGELIVEQVLKTPADGDFAVWEAAVDALRRRWDIAQRDALRVTQRPHGGGVWGTYVTGRGGSAKGVTTRRRTGKGRAREPRPYVTELESVDPIRVSCDCRDFLTSSLGLCKHLLVVLDGIFANPRRAAAAAQGTAVAGVRLAWHPALGLHGFLDRLEGLRLEVSAPSRATGRPTRTPVSAGALQPLFRKQAPDPKVLASPKRRLALLRALANALRPPARAQAMLASTSAASALVRDELARAERIDKLGREAPRVMAHLRSLKRQLYPYQREGTERFLRVGRLLLADDMGLGKTTQAIAACHALHLAGNVRRGVIVVPASLKQQWLREWQEATDVPAAVVDGTPSERRRCYRELDTGFLILGYEQLLRDFEHIEKLAPELVVLDEAQRIKNYATKSAMQVKALAPAYRLALTGTPMENRLEELASILDWIDDVALAPKWRLVPWYTAWESNGDKKGKSGARHLNTLRQRLHGVFVRRVRREVLKQLPARSDTRVPVQMTPQQSEEHDLLNQSIAQLLAISTRRPLLQAEFLKLMQLLTRQRIVSNGLGQLHFEDLWPTYAKARPDAALLDGLFAPKLFELRRLVSNLVVEQHRKVVVFSQWRRMLRLAEWSLRDILDEANLRAVFFTGAERPSQRTRSIVDFHDDPSVRVMFLSDAGGVGLNLQRAANACINLELPWNPAVLEQRVGRIYRLGQKHPIDVFNLVSETGIESRIAALVGVKQALFSGLFDGTSDDIRFDSAASFLTRVERIVSPEVLSTGANHRPADDRDDLADDEMDPALPHSDELGEPALADELGDRTSTDGPEPSAPAGAPPNLLSTGQAHGSTSAHALVDDVAASAWAPATADLLAALRVERTPQGTVRIEAPPQAAQALIALFQGLSKLLIPESS